ncbi:MAG: 50S ribosomal protein L25 [Planctomycetes bacterium]|nr:50S ribosomal protein L25 [Planctomycetota bacterium]MBI3844344.1 50S ribosomal protein L25 [Planctomycetota bacterium]
MTTATKGTHGTPVLEATVRAELGSNACKHVRAKGLVPGVVYGLKKEAQSISLPRKPLEEVVQRGARMIELRVGGQSDRTIIKEVQFDVFGEEVRHVDFERIALDKTIVVRIPLEFEGIAKGQADGGTVAHQLNDIEVECLPDAIPDKVVVDVTPLMMGETFHLKDIKMPAGVKAVGNPEAIVVSVNLPTLVVPEVAPTEEKLEPEVINAKPAKEEEGEEGAAGEKAPKAKDKEKK